MSRLQYREIRTGVLEEQFHGLDDADVMTSPRVLAQPGRVVWDVKGQSGEIEEGVRIEQGVPSVAVVEAGGRTWEVSSLASGGRFHASTVIDGVQVSISARDRVAFDRIAPGLRQLE